MLNTYVPSNTPVLIKYDGESSHFESGISDLPFSGGEDPDLEFTMGPDTSVYRSCSATINGEMYVFGGAGNFKKQVCYDYAQGTFNKLFR